MRSIVIQTYAETYTDADVTGIAYHTIRKARRDVRSTLIHTYAETYTDADVTGIASC